MLWQVEQREQATGDFGPGESLGEFLAAGFKRRTRLIEPGHFIRLLATAVPWGAMPRSGDAADDHGIFGLPQL
jgi:hypothetical protein